MRITGDIADLLFDFGVCDKCGCELEYGYFIKKEKFYYFCELCGWKVEAKRKGVKEKV